MSYQTRNQLACKFGALAVTHRFCLVFAITRLLCFLFLVWMTSTDSANEGVCGAQFQHIAADAGKTYFHPYACSPIPKRLHLVWLDNCWPDQNVISPDAAATAKRWKQMLGREWTVTVWDNAKVREEFPELYYMILRRLERGKVPAAWSADIAKIAVLTKYGGISIDSDIVPLRPVPDWLLQKEFALCNAGEDPYELWTWHTWKCLQLNNAPLGAFPGSKFFSAFLKRIVNNTQRLLDQQNWTELKLPIWHTGPMDFSRFAIDYGDPLFRPYTPRNYLTHYPALLFGPCGHAVRPKSLCSNEVFWKTEYPDAIGLHQWGESWTNAKGQEDECPKDVQRSPVPRTINKLVLDVPQPNSHTSSENIPLSVVDLIPALQSAAPMCTPVPRLLHLVGASSENVEKWRAQLGPRWEITVWTDEKLQTGFKELYQYFDRRSSGGEREVAPAAGWMSEILRFSILTKFGGIYLDNSITPQPIPEWMLTQEFAMCSRSQSWDQHTKRCRELSPKVLGAVPGSLPFTAYLEHMLFFGTEEQFGLVEFTKFFGNHAFNRSHVAHARLTHFPYVFEAATQ